LSTLTAQESLYISNGKDINFGTSSPVVTFVSGITVANDTLSISGDLNVLGGTLNGVFQLQRLVVGGGATVTLSNSSTQVLVMGSVSIIANSTLAAQGSLRLLSNSSGTARIESISTGSSITGNVIVERYIPGGRRAYRFFSHPFATSQSITSTLIDNIDVTGSGGASNGFTNTQTNAPSAWWFDPVTANTNTASPNSGWTAFTTANTANWDRYEGIYLMVRGAKTEGLTGTAYTPSAVTIDMSGTINQGSQTISLTKGTAAGYNLIGNPYPSPVNVIPALSAMSSKNGSAFWVWNTNAGTKGAYEPILYAASSYSLPSNSAMLLDVSANTSVTFQESHKVATGTSLFKTTSIANMVEFKVFSDSGNLYWDKLYLMLDPNAADTIEQHDARKVTNNDLTFGSYSADGSKLCVDARPFIDSGVIPLFFDAKLQKEYELRVEDFTMNDEFSLFLHDKYLNKVSQLSYGFSYKFDITADSATFKDRFAIGMKQKETTTINVSAINKHVKIYPNPSKEEIVIQCSNVNATDRNVYLQITDMAGRVMHYGVINAENTRVNISNYAPGVYTVSISYPDCIVTQRVVKQ
jgi:hypothetical protein